MNFCEICHETRNPAYKCPKCRMKYCSVSCCQKHRTSNLCREKPSENPAEEILSTPIQLTEEEETDRLSIEVLQRLDHSDEIRDLLRNPHLRTMMKTLNRSANPAEDMQKAMLEPIFVQFVDHLLRIVD